MTTTTIDYFTEDWEDIADKIEEKQKQQEEEEEEEINEETMMFLYEQRASKLGKHRVTQMAEDAKKKAKDPKEARHVPLLDSDVDHPPFAKCASRQCNCGQKVVLGMEEYQQDFLIYLETNDKILCVEGDNIGAFEWDLQILEQLEKKKITIRQPTLLLLPSKQRLIVQLQILKYKMKVSKDTKALLIYALNADATGYKKRIKQFKRHASQFGEYFEEACGGISEVLNSAQEDYRRTYSALIKVGGAYTPLEDEYLLVCKNLKEQYDFFCGDRSGLHVFDLISSKLWKDFRGKTD
jgi:hypothetical protein